MTSLNLIAAFARCCLIWVFASFHLHGVALPVPLAQDPLDLISSRAWLDDPSNSLGPDQVKAMTWTPYNGPLRRGFMSSTTWLRLKIDPPIDQSRFQAQRQTRLILRIQPGQLDELALFDPRFPDQPPQLAGDTHDWRLSEYRSFNQNFVITSPSEPIEVLLRMRTTSHHGIHVEAMHWDDAESKDRLNQLFKDGVIAFLLMILLWAMNAWKVSRDRVIGAFIVHQTFSLLFTLSLFGFPRVYLSDWLSAPMIDRLTSMVFSMSATALVWFHWHFLREFNPPQIGMRFLKLLVMASPLTLVMQLFGLVSPSLQIVSVIYSLSSLLFLLLAWRIEMPAPNAPLRLTRQRLIWIYLSTSFIMASAALPALGLLPSATWSIYSATSYGLASAALLLSAMNLRRQHAATVSRQVESELALSAAMVSYEREKRKEQEQFMTMLMHELTNPLATAHLAIGSLAAKSPMRGRGYRAIDSMRDIIRRCSLTGEFEVNAAAPQFAPVNVQALLQELIVQLPADSKIMLSTAPTLPECATDRQLLRVILNNLLDNALKYRVQSSLIEVTASPHMRGALAGLQLCVMNACGDADLPDPQYLFTKYWRGLGAKRLAGSGLGLYLSSLIAQRIGGELRYQPENSNVRFELWLPI